jgi:outer membrane biosynthesis protein TonB
MPIETEPITAARLFGRREPDRMAPGLLGSALLHGIVVLLILAAIPETEPPSPGPMIVPLNLVLLGNRTGGPESPIAAPLPQQQAHEEAPKPDPAKAIPVPAAPKPVRRPVAAAPLATAPPEEELSQRLKALAKLRQPTPPLPPDLQQQQGIGVSNVTASSGAGHARDATWRVKDFIRAQVERHWNFRIGSEGSRDWTVAIRIALDPDGGVVDAQIVDDGRHQNDLAFRDFALSARNAVYMSSPISIPPDAAELARDIVVDFSPKQATQ